MANFVDLFFDTKEGKTNVAKNAICTWKIWKGKKNL